MSIFAFSPLRIGFVLCVAAAVTFAAFCPAQEPLAVWRPGAAAGAAPEAPSGFGGLTNGFLTQEGFDGARETFEEREDVDEGLGPVFNAQGCVECHHNPSTGGISQVTELRVGHRVSLPDRFFRSSYAFEEPPGGSLIQDRAIDAAIQERVPESEEVRTFRTSLNTLGDGFIEAIANQTLLDIAKDQEEASGGRIRGQAVWVPVLEAGNALRIGRFGWKAQHASLLSFSADAYLNEMGITTPLLPKENTSLGRSIGDYDAVADPEDDGEDLEAFASFMRATRVPPRDEELAATPGAVAGSRIFEDIGCALCHVSAIVTSPAGTPINGGAFIVPAALGLKTIHPYSDFLLHDVGTGDGIVQNGGQETARKLRTPPLWGVRTRTRFLHDGTALTFRAAILRHDAEAGAVTYRYRQLGPPDQQNVVQFLKSL